MFYNQIYLDIHDATIKRLWEFTAAVKLIFLTLMRSRLIFVKTFN